MSSVMDAAALQHLELGGAEVVADGPDGPHLGEEAGGEREVHGGAAEHPSRSPNGVLDRVKCD